MSERTNFLISVGDKVRARFNKVGFEGLNEVERNYFCLTEVEAQANNGGFDQFYFNRSGDIAIEAVGALKAMGAEKAAAIVDSANKLFKNGQPPKEWFLRQHVLEAIREKVEEKFEELDAQFFKYPDDLEALAYAYVMKHSKELGLEMNTEKQIKDLEKSRLYSRNHIPVDAGCLVVASLGFWIILKFVSVPIWLIFIVLGITAITLLCNIINYILCGRKLRGMK